MADIEGEIEALGLRVMRAWVAGEEKDLKRLLARDFVCMVGSRPPQLLDRPSFLAACQRGFACTRFHFREVFVRPHGRAAWFVAGGELDLKLGTREWKGEFLVTDLWRRGRLARGWKLAERSLARLEPDEDLAARIHALQLWNVAKGGKA